MRRSYHEFEQKIFNNEKLPPWELKGFIIFQMVSIWAIRHKNLGEVNSIESLFKDLSTQGVTYDLTHLNKHFKEITPTYTSIMKYILKYCLEHIADDKKEGNN